MKKVKVNKTEFELEEKDAALVTVLKELVLAIKMLNNRGSS